MVPTRESLSACSKAQTLWLTSWQARGLLHLLRSKKQHVNDASTNSRGSSAQQEAAQADADQRQSKRRRDATLVEAGHLSDAR
eukprot:3007099-Pleurochrysis_carterae.AAC.1